MIRGSELFFTKLILLLILAITLRLGITEHPIKYVIIRAGCLEVTHSWLILLFVLVILTVYPAFKGSLVSLRFVLVLVLFFVVIDVVVLLFCFVLFLFCFFLFFFFVFFGFFFWGGGVCFCFVFTKITTSHMVSQ